MTITEQEKEIRDYAEQQFYTLFKGVNINKDSEDEKWLKALYINAFINGMKYSLIEHTKK